MKHITVKDIAEILLGTLLAGFGASLQFKADLGSTPLSIFEQGVARTVGMPLGTAIWIVCVALLAVGWLLNKNLVGIGSIAVSVLYGPFVSLANGLFPFVPQGFLTRLAFCAAGILLLSFGVAVYIHPKKGVGPTEIIMMYLSEKFSMQISLTRILSDALWFLLGWALGGTVGIGSVLGLLLSGPCIQFFSRRLGRRNGK